MHGEPPPPLHEGSVIGGGHAELLELRRPHLGPLSGHERPRELGYGQPRATEPRLDEILNRGHGLIRAPHDPEPRIVNSVSSGQLSARPHVTERRRDRWVVHRGVLRRQEERTQDADDPGRRVTQHRERARLTLEPQARARLCFGALVLPHQREDGVAITRARGFTIGSAGIIERVEPSDPRVISAQEHEVVEAPLAVVLRQRLSEEPLQESLGQLPPERAPSCAVALEQIALEQRSHQIVGHEAVRASLHERQRSHPVVQGRCVVPQHGTEAVLVGDTQHGAHVEGLSMTSGREVVQEPIEQRRDDVGPELGDDAGLLAGDLGQEREGERVTMRDAMDGLLRRAVRHSPLPQQLSGVRVVEGAEADGVQDPRPRRIRAPRLGGRISPGEHHERLTRELRQQPRAKPRLEARELLERVHPHEPPRLRGELHLAVGADARPRRVCQRLGHRVRPGLEIPGVEAQHPPVSADRGAEVPRERALPDPPRPVEEHHRRRSAVEERVEARELLRPPREADPPVLTEALSQGVGHWPST